MKPFVKFQRVPFGKSAQTYIHVCIHAYVYTYIHTYIHIWLFINVAASRALLFSELAALQIRPRNNKVLWFKFIRCGEGRSAFGLNIG